MSEEMDFFIYLLEYYAQHKQKSANEILKEWDSKNITHKIYDGYWGYHTEALENAFMDIDSLMHSGTHAW